ncbi:MAG: Hpt domain [Pseudomonadota bacterium]|jgi:HPt (histidine-containing phosphotransfer) domain-containing protein
MTQQKIVSRDIEFIRRELELVTDKFAEDGMSDILDEVLDAFLSEADSLMESYRAQLVRCDFDSFAKVAHSLKGTFGAIGQTTLKETMAEQEKMAHSRAIVWDDLQHQFSNFEREFDALFEAVSKIRNSRSGQID